MNLLNRFPLMSVTCDDWFARPTTKKTGQAGALTPGLLALPPSKRRFLMGTPSAPSSHQVAAGWRANDLTPGDVAPLLNNFITKFQAGAPDECWLWSGSRMASGYGILGRSYRGALLAHRVSWVAFTGASLTDNLTIDHLCFNKLCVNPEHLEPVTLEENLRRMREHYGYTPRQPRPGPKRAFTSLVGFSDEERRLWVNARERKHYWANREKVRAAREARGRVIQQCPHCELAMRRDSVRRHVVKQHPEAR